MTSRVPRSARQPRRRPRAYVVVLTVLTALVLAGTPALAAVDRSATANGSARFAHAKHRQQKDHRTRHARRPHRHPVRKAATRPRHVAPTPVPTTPTVNPAAVASPLATLATRLPAGWLSTRDGARRVDSLTSAELTPSASASAVHVAIDDTVRYQSMDGFGAALTESSAHLLMQLSPGARTAALRSLFDPVHGAGIDLVRLPLGASDFAMSRYTYDDLPAGQSDPTLGLVSVAHDDADILPVLKEALKINPSLQVLGTPWSAPAWMKSNRSLLGGTLLDGDTDLYARYLVKVVQQWRSRGVPLRFLTLGNEPEYAPADYPGMLMSPTQEAALAVAVSGRLAEAGVTDVRLIGYDHNWGDTTFSTSLLADVTANPVLAGTAFHCYAGSPSAQETVHAAAPDKGIWFTECTGGDWALSYAGNLAWNTDTLLLGTTRTWARSVLFWNLALSPTGGPHTGGCGNCRGVLTVDPKSGAVTRNVEYDVLALAGKAVRPGAVRVATPASVSGIKTVAYVNPDGSHALTAYNSWSGDRQLVVDAGSTHVGAPVPAGGVVTLLW